jgi:hypothetical protein
MPEDLQFFEVASSAMLERGLTTPEQVHAERSALHAELGMEPPPAYVPSTQPGAAPAAASAPSAAALLGSEPAPPGQAPVPAEQAAVDPAEAMDAAIFAGPASPSAYNFGPAAPGVQTSPEQELAMRSLFHQEGVPASIGDQIGKLFNAAVAKPPTPAMIEMSRQTATAQLTRQWGDDFQRNVAIAQAEITRMAKTRPEIREMLDVSGLGNNPWVIISVFNMAKAKGRAR